MQTELLLIRHGESLANVGLSTDPDCLLTDLGVRQARDAARLLATWDFGGWLALASPYSRTQITAGHIADATALTFRVDERIREWGDVATVSGRTYHPETADELIGRLAEFLDACRGQKVLVVSHAAPIAVLTQLARGETPNVEGEFWNGVKNCCLRRLTTTGLQKV